MPRRWLGYHRQLEPGRSLEIELQEEPELKICWIITDRTAGIILHADGQIDGNGIAHAVIHGLSNEPYEVIASFKKGKQATFPINFKE